MKIFLVFSTLLRALQSFACCCFFFRIPDDDTVSYGSIKQNGKCIDTLGHQDGQTVGLYECHGQGGNQVNDRFYGSTVLWFTVA